MSIRITASNYREWFTRLGDLSLNGLPPTAEGNSMDSRTLFVVLCALGGKQGAATLELADEDGSIAFSLNPDFDWNGFIDMDPFCSNDLQGK